MTCKALLSLESCVTSTAVPLAGPIALTASYGLQTFRKVIGEGSIGRVHLGRWQETDVAIKVLGHIPSPATVPVAAPMQSTGQMSAVNEGESEEDEGPDGEVLDTSMDSTIKTLEREVSTFAFLQDRPGFGPSWQMLL